MSWLILHDKSYTFAYDAENRLASVSGDSTVTSLIITLLGAGTLSPPRRDRRSETPSARFAEHLPQIRH